MWYRFDVHSGHRDETSHTLGLDDLGRTRLRITSQIIYDAYQRNRTTGSFVLVDEATTATVAAGMQLGE